MPTYQEMHERYWKREYRARLALALVQAGGALWLLAGLVLVFS